ncbi:AATF family protein [Megaselia abdita]
MLNIKSNEEEFSLNRMEDESSESRKAEHVKNQVVIWDKLLEKRIKFNKVLLNCGKLSLDDGEGSEEIKSLKTNTNILLDKLVEVQNELYKTNPKLRDVANKSKNYKKSLIDNFDKFKIYRNQILNKWENRVKLFSLNNQSVNTTEVDILTKINTFTKKHQTDDNQQLQSYLQNDQEFYATLIKEFIERKGSNPSLAKQIKNKVKKPVDTKSSKGRKISELILEVSYWNSCLSKGLSLKRHQCRTIL